MQQSLKQILENNHTRGGRTFDLAVQALIVLSLVCFSLETLPNLNPTARRWLSAIETITVLLFTIEYLLRIWVATPRLGYIFSFFGIVDLLAILPYFIGLAIDLRSVRVFRLLRLFRMFKLARFSAATRRFNHALVVAREELILFMCVVLMLVYLASVGIYFFEHDAQPQVYSSVFHSLWWAVVTLTTVGYGDMCPITAGGKIFTFCILLIGLLVISVPAGLLASALDKARQMEDEEHDRHAAHSTKATEASIAPKA